MPAILTSAMSVFHCQFNWDYCDGAVNTNLH